MVVQPASRAKAQPNSREHAKRVDVLLVSNPGGHLLQMHLMRNAWSDLSHAWVTNDKDDARSILDGETVFFAYWPTTRNLVNLVRNLFLAWRLVRKLRPRVLVTAGAALAVPFAWVVRLHGGRVVYVESLTRINGPSLSCRLIAPIADRLYAQWPELRTALPKARFVGNILYRS